MCGNPYQTNPVKDDGSPYNLTKEFYGIQATYQQDQVVKISVHIATNHGGRMSVRVCPNPRNRTTQECFEKKEHHLARVDNGKLYWYLRSNDVDISKEFRLPKGVHCRDGCILQWWWVGYQHCAMPCEDLKWDVDGECGKNMLNPSSSFPKCDSISRTEQFANCADIKITPSDVQAPPPPKPVPVPVPLPKPDDQPPKKWGCPTCYKVNDTQYWLCTKCDQA
jgi:hypothetical protein